MAQYSPWYEEYTKYPYRKNPVSMKTRYKNFIVWFLKSHWMLLAFVFAGFLAIYLEAYMQDHWYVWIFQNPFSEDRFIDNGWRIFAMSIAWLSVIPTLFFIISLFEVVPKSAEEMLSSPTNTRTVCDWIRRSYEMIPATTFFMFISAGFGLSIKLALCITIVVIVTCLAWCPIYEKFFKNGNTNQ